MKPNYNEGGLPVQIHAEPKINFSFTFPGKLDVGFDNADTVRFIASWNTRKSTAKHRNLINGEFRSSAILVKSQDLKQNREWSVPGRDLPQAHWRNIQLLNPDIGPKIRAVTAQIHMHLPKLISNLNFI